MKKILCLICAVFLVVLLHNAVQFGEEYMSTKSKDGETVIVEIPKGAAESTIAKILKENKLIDYEISSIAETAILDVFQYIKKDEPKQDAE